MTVDVQLETPLAEAINLAIQPKLNEFGWATGGGDDAALSEYIVLLLVNGKTQQDVAAELAGDLLGLGPDDPAARDFTKWLFDTVDTLAAQHGQGKPPPEQQPQQPQAANGDGMPGASQGESAPADGAMDTDMSTTGDGPGEINAPTGPKAMRNGSDSRGGRGKRLVGQINRAMDRSQENVLHRLRGNDRVNSHGRAPPSGPRLGMGAGRMQRGGLNSRSASIAHGMANMNGPPVGPAGMNGMHGLNGMNGMNGMNGWAPMPPQPMEFMQMLNQQAHMLQEMQQQLMLQQGAAANNGGEFGQGRPKSLFERAQMPNQRGNFRGRGGHHQQNGHHQRPADAAPKAEPAPAPAPAPAAAGEDTEMTGSQPHEPANPEDTVCRYNLSCTNKDCKYAHQSPAAPPGTTVDVQDPCSFGAACKNHKCTGRHPSPAARAAHQSQQDCRFWPHCQNPRCPFRHPTAGARPPCRNGGDCKVPGCEFTHTTVMCKFRPCTNRYCTYRHEEGQRGTFSDKVWTAGGVGGGEAAHISERAFADEKAPVEEVLPGSGEGDAEGAAESAGAGAQGVAG